MRERYKKKLCENKEIYMFLLFFFKTMIKKNLNVYMGIVWNFCHMKCYEEMYDYLNSILKMCLYESNRF